MGSALLVGDRYIGAATSPRRKEGGGGEGGGGEPHHCGWAGRTVQLCNAALCVHQVSQGRGGTWRLAHGWQLRRGPSAW